MDQYYTLASQHFISTGKDGFTAFLDPCVQRISSPDLEDLMTI